MKTLLTLLAITLLFTGCGADKEPMVTAPKAMPSWYTNPPQSNNQYLYEVAEGADKKEAIAHALDLMVSTLSITIASEYKSHTTARSGAINSYQQDVDNIIQTSVKAIRISNYSVVESTEQGFRRYLVLIKSDKAQLFKSLRRELDEKITLLESQESNIQTKNVVEQLRFYKRANSDFAGIEQTLNVMNVLNKDFDSTPYIQTTSHYKKSYDDLRAKITFGFKANSDAMNLIEPIKAGLSAKQLLIQERDDDYHLRIVILAKVDTAHSMGFDLARTAINLSTKDHLGTTIGSNKLNINGQSTQGYAIAKENVAIKLNRLIEKEGIESVLGLSF
ncbi:MAG: LPP20 family lipoprotein [Sulfurimonadaceae bacterium]